MCLLMLIMDSKIHSLIITNFIKIIKIADIILFVDLSDNFILWISKNMDDFRSIF